MTTCASNMRQIAASLMIYLNNFNGWMPPQIEEVDNFGDPAAVQPNPGLDGISNVMDPAQANGRVFYCPSVEGYTLPSHPVTALSDTSYMPNGAVFARPVASVTQASQKIASIGGFRADAGRDVVERQRRSLWRSAGGHASVFLDLGVLIRSGAQ